MAKAQLAPSLPSASVCPLSHTSAHLYLCLSHSLSLTTEKKGLQSLSGERSLLSVSAEGAGAATSSGSSSVLHVRKTYTHVLKHTQA